MAEPNMDNPSGKLKLCVFLTDPMKVLYKKGEIKERYYNPDNLFSEVHMISFSDDEVEAEKIKIVAGRARLYIYCLGRRTVLNTIRLFFGKLAEIVRLLEKIQPDCIRAYDISLTGVLSCYCAKKMRIPCILSLHGNFSDQRIYDRRPILQIRRIFERFSLTHCDILICISQALKDYAEAKNVDNVKVIYEGIRLEQFFQSQPREANPKILTILSVGRLSRPKDHFCLIRAIKDLHVKLILIGDGEYYEKLKKLVIDLSIVDKVEFIKSIPNQQIHNYYRLADIFALSTRYEGLCIPVIEAMASGLAVVASDIPAIREVVHDCGILSKNNPLEFNKNIRFLIDNPSLREQLGKKGQERAKIFDFAISEKQEAGVYRRLLATGSRGST